MPCNKEGPLMPTQKLLERKALIVGIVINVLQVLAGMAVFFMLSLIHICANLWEEVKDRLDNPGIGLSGGQPQRCLLYTSRCV